MIQGPIIATDRKSHILKLHWMFFLLFFFLVRLLILCSGFNYPLSSKPSQPKIRYIMPRFAFRCYPSPEEQERFFSGEGTGQEI